MLELFKVRKKTCPAKILVVGDEPDFVSVVEYRLKLADYVVVTASGGKQGLELAAAEKPDLIVLDTNAPAMNDREMIERVQSDAALRHTPVIVLAARHEDEDILPSTRGVSECVTKPFDFGRLMDRIQAALENGKPS
jgi:DNA-binding response OmpR family regulator